MVAFEDFRKASSLISASRPQFFIPQQQETCQDAGAAFIGHSASHHVRDLTGNQACSQKPYGNGRVDLAGFQLVITKPLAEQRQGIHGIRYSGKEYKGRRSDLL